MEISKIILLIIMILGEVSLSIGLTIYFMKEEKRQKEGAEFLRRYFEFLGTSKTSSDDNEHNKESK